MRRWHARSAPQGEAQLRIAGYQLFRRRALESMRRWPVPERELKAELSRCGLSWQDIEVRLSDRRSLAEIRRPAHDAPHSPARPKYFDKLREFALGE